MGYLRVTCHVFVQSVTELQLRWWFLPWFPGLSRVLRAASPFSSTANGSGIAERQESLGYCQVLHLWKV